MEDLMIPSLFCYFFDPWHHIMYGILSLCFYLTAVQTLAFTPSQIPSSRGGRLFSIAETDIVSYSLEKPLGMILEEVEEGQPSGVYVLELAEEGSATSCPEVLGMKLQTVMDENVSNMLFDDVMAKLIEAPSPVSISFLKEGRSNGMIDTGSPVKIKVIDEGKEVEIEAKVGDNLRQVLLGNDLEVYKGLKAKLGNCGGGGQCGHCSVEFLEDEWGARSEYEDKKLKSPNARLSCLNNIQGPATIML